KDWGPLVAAAAAAAQRTRAPPTVPAKTMTRFMSTLLVAGRSRDLPAWPEDLTRAELLELALDVLPVEDLAAGLLLGVVPAEEDHADDRPQVEAAHDLHGEARHLHVGDGREPV